MLLIMHGFPKVDEIDLQLLNWTFKRIYFYVKFITSGPSNFFLQMAIHTHLWKYGIQYTLY